MFNCNKHYGGTNMTRFVQGEYPASAFLAPSKSIQNIISGVNRVEQMKFDSSTIVSGLKPYIFVPHSAQVHTTRYIVWLK
jgi:hypothetical protein